MSCSVHDFDQFGALMGTATVVGGAPEAATAFERKSKHLQHHTVEIVTPLGMQEVSMLTHGKL